MKEKLTKKEFKEQRKLERYESEAEIKNYEMWRKRKKVIAWILGGIILIGAVVLIAIFAGSQSTNQTANSQISNIKFEKITSSDLSFGNSRAKVILVEYADFECPACAAYNPFIQQLLTDFKGKILYVYRFFPLTTIHPNALISARAGYAAFKQGKFEKMENLLFTNQADWANLPDPTNIFISYAVRLGLNKNQFLQDINSSLTDEFIKSQQARWLSDGLNSTPTFAINGKIIANPTSYQAFKQLIQKVIK